MSHKFKLKILSKVLVGIIWGYEMADNWKKLLFASVLYVYTPVIQKMCWYYFLDISQTFELMVLQ